MTFSIIRHHGFLDLFGEKEKYYERGKNYFNDTKNNMLKWIRILANREIPSYLPYVDITPNERLFSLLKKLEYIPIKTKADLIKEKRKLFSDMYESAGVSKTFANTIIKDLIDYIEFVRVEIEQSGETLDVEYNNLVELLRTKNTEENKLGIELASMCVKGKLYVGKENDNFASIKLKLSALTTLLSDDFIRYGDELLKVHSPIEHYPISYDLNGSPLEEYIEQEEEIFNHYGKVLTKEHIEKIEMYHSVLFELPNSLDGLDSDRKDYIDSLY